jgi:hypothetical protein
MTDPARIDARRRLLATLLIAPAAAAAVWIASLEVWRAREPESSLFVTPFAFSLTEAIARDDVQRGYDFLRAGQDPNSLIAVRHPEHTGNRDVLVAPIVWAVMSNSPQSVLMLLGHGARLDVPSADTAVCLAQKLGRQEILDLLERYGHAPAGHCTEGGP